MLMLPSVTTLSIVLDVERGRVGEQIVSALFKRVTEYLPQLEVFRFTVNDKVDFFWYSMVVDLIPRLRALRVVILPPAAFKDSMLRALSVLPLLRDVRIDCERSRSFLLGDVEDVRCYEGTGAGLDVSSFKSLCYFSFIARSSFEVEHILCHPCFWVGTLRTLWVQFGYSSTGLDVDLRSFLCLIRFCYSLDALHIRYVESTPTQSFASAASIPLLHFSDLQLFTSVGCLTSFTIDYPRHIHLSVEDFYTLAEASSRFHVLWLNPCPRWIDPESLPPLSVLIPFALFCPRLISLGICFDCSLQAEFPPFGVRFPILSELFVGYSVMSSDLSLLARDQRSFIARYLSHILPDNSVIKTVGDFEGAAAQSFVVKVLVDGGQSRSSEVARGWHIVQNLVRLFVQETMDVQERVQELVVERAELVRELRRGGFEHL